MSAAAAASSAVIALLCRELCSILQPLQRIVFVLLRIVKAADAAAAVCVFSIPRVYSMRDTCWLGVLGRVETLSAVFGAFGSVFESPWSSEAPQAASEPF